MKKSTDSGDGTITDNRTGLTWVKDGNSAGCNNGGKLTWEDAVSFCENLAYAGHTDWRLPSVQELQSIVDYGTYTPAINSTYFPNTQGSLQGSFYWSSTTYVYRTTYAWVVNFYRGHVDNYNKTGSYYVRPVRGGQ